MKSALSLIVLILLLLGLAISLSAFIGRDLLKNFESLTIKDSEGQEDHGKVLSRFAIFSDTHSDTESTALALENAKKLGVSYIVHTGDWSTVGTVAELNKQKELFDESGIPYWGVMGDHDRWQSGSANFEKVLGSPYESFEREGIAHILLDSSDIENGFGSKQLDWFEQKMEENLDKKILIFMHLPIYHPTSDRTLQSKGGSSKERSQEAARFLNIIKGKKVLGIFSGDHHFSASYTEPQTDVRIFISGAVTQERNLQRPRFTLVEVYEDGFIKAIDQVIN